MQGRKPAADSPLFIYGDPYAKLPRSAFYAALDKHLDLRWVRAATSGLYADGIGRPSLDPVVFVKLMLVAYFENLPGDSELAFRIADSLTVRRFLGYGLDEDTPERTTILKTRQRWPVEVFEAIFMRVLTQLGEAGLVKGAHLGTDTVLIDANASLDNLRHRELGCTYAQFVKALYAQDSQPASASEIAAKDAQRPHKASNAEWVSATDPDAAIAVHPDGHTALSYRLDATVDLDTGAIVAIGAAPADVRDSVDLPQRVEQAKENLAELGLTPQALTGDRGHHSADNLVEMEAQQVTPIIRQRAAAGESGFRPENFTYMPEADEYICPAGQRLTRRDCARVDEPMRYRAAGGVCRSCQNFGKCTKSRQGRVLRRSLHQAELERNRERVRSPEGKELLSKHRQRAEGPWSYAKLYGGLARISPRGLANAVKKALLQGIGWNLMKLIARLTGLAPRGKSEMGKADAGWGRPMVNVCVLIRHFGARIGHYGAMLGLWPRLRLRRVRTDQTHDFSRKRLLSQGC
jgi:transposase